MLIKCGCCDKQLKIYYPDEGSIVDDIFEINGVAGTKEQWQDLFREIGLIK